MCNLHFLIIRFNVTVLKLYNALAISDLLLHTLYQGCSMISAMIHHSQTTQRDDPLDTNSKHIGHALILMVLYLCKCSLHCRAYSPTIYL